MESKKVYVKFRKTGVVEIKDYFEARDLANQGEGIIIASVAEPVKNKPVEVVQTSEQPVLDEPVQIPVVDPETEVEPEPEVEVKEKLEAPLKAVKKPAKSAKKGTKPAKKTKSKK